MFDIETFQRQCDLLASCTHKRAVLDSVVASLTLIKNSLSSYNGLPLPAVSKVGNDELTYRVVLWVFALTAWMLAMKRLPRQVIRGLNMLNQALFTWIWTPGGRWCRCSVHVQQIFGAITMARSAMWLCVNRRSKQAMQIGRMMPTAIREIWWPAAADGARTSQAVNLFLNMQLAALLKPDTANDSAWLYCWWQRGFRYVGMARATRANLCKCGGPLSRFVEHVSLRTRAHHRDAQKLRYRRARAFAGGSFWWLVTFVGPTKQIAAAEHLEIMLHKPIANCRPDAAPRQRTNLRVQRNRPHRWQRRRANVSAGPKHAAWEGSVGSCQLTKCMAPVAAVDVDMATWSFSEAYRHLQRCYLGATAMQGPMCIYNPAHKQLLMIWAASGHEVDWPRMERIWKSDCGPVTLARFWHLVKGPQRLQKLRQNLDQELRNRGLPATRPVFVPVPVKEMVTAARCQFAGSLRRSFPPSVVRWCLSQVRFSHGKFPRHCDSWTHIKDARKLDWNKLHEVAPGSMYDALAGQNMQRIEQSWDVPCFLSDAELQRRFQKSMGQAFARVPGCVQTEWPCLPKSSLQSYCRRRDKCWAAYKQHTKDMNPRPGESVVPDDKCKRFAWKMPKDVYHVLLAFFVLLAANWQLTTLSVISANKACYDLVVALLPRHLLGFLGMNREVQLLPYAYAMIKAKCFTPEGRTCLTAKHSCVRKIISYAAWPKKSCWRMVSRGLQIALQRGVDNWQVWTMRDAPSILRKRIANLIVPSDPYTCCKCGRSKAKLEATVHDAGQFFECVTVADALHAAQQVLDITAGKTGCFYACVFRKRKKAGFLSPHGFRFAARKMRCFSFQELFLVFAAATSIAYVSVGSHVVQLSTLAIGGIMSMIASAMVLCLDEHRWLQNPEAWLSCGYLGSVPWERQTASLRYVDDLLQVSAVYCAQCLALLPDAVYKVPFKLAESGVHVTWIDLQIDLEPVRIGMAQKPVAIPPSWAAEQGYARSWLCGRFARWQQVGLSQKQMIDAVTCAFWELLQQGYSLRVLRALVYSFKHERWAAEFRVLQACFSAVSARPQ